MEKNKNVFIVIVVVLILAAGALWYFNTNSGTLVDNNPTPSAQDVVADTDALQAGPDVGFNDLAPSVAPAAKLSYVNALKIYGDNKRIQFGASVATNFDSCVTGANSESYKNGTKIMLDNRSAVQSTIKIGGVSYVLAPYQFRIVTLSSATLPITYGVDCNKYQNVLSIQLQK